MKQLKTATSPISLARRRFGGKWTSRFGTAGNAVHKQVTAELETRKVNADWQRMKRDIGNYAWDQVWQTVGDPMYSQYFEEDARAADGLFEENLEPWADAMMEGQFSAGTMAQRYALNVVDGLDVEPFKGPLRIAQNTCWWWAFDVGAVFCNGPRRCRSTAVA